MSHYFRSTAILLVLLAMVAVAQAQDTTGTGDENFPAFRPTLSLDFSADGRWRSGGGFAIEQGRLWSALHLTPEISILGLIRSPYDSTINWYDVGRRRYLLAQLFAQYQSTIPISTINLNYTVRAGKLEWYPDFDDPRLVLEHIDLYTNPTDFYGVNLAVGAMLYEPARISAYAEGYSGDLIDQSVKPKLTEAVLRADPSLIGDFSFHAQAGKSQSSIHAVNYAFLAYRPTLGDFLSLDARIGKLVAIDQTPYGIHLGLVGSFKYIELGGYYERRLNQDPGTQILGFYYRIIGPPELARFLGMYQILYDFNTNTLRFTIPFLSFNFNW
jgi:hypothetical protein